MFTSQCGSRRGDHRAKTSLASRAGNEANMIAGQTVGSLRQKVSNSRKVLNQALAFTDAFLCSYILLYVNAFLFLGSGKYNITVFALQTFFYPLQGKTD